MRSTRYEAEIELQTADGRHVTYRGDGVGPMGQTAEQLLDGAEAAALEQEPGARVISSRTREVTD